MLCTLKVQSGSARNWYRAALHAIGTELLLLMFINSLSYLNINCTQCSARSRYRAALHAIGTELLLSYLNINKTQCSARTLYRAALHAIGTEQLSTQSGQSLYYTI